MAVERSKASLNSHVRISKRKYSLIVQCFCHDLTATVTANIGRINRNTANRYFSLFNQVIIQAAVQERYQIGFENGIEVDESYFGAKRIRGKRGRGAGGKTIVLGLRKRSGSVYADVISDTRRETVMPIIRRVIQSGSDIYTDGWRSYDALAVYGYNHKKVRHDKNEFAREDGTHINGIESYWSWTKRRAIKFNGVKRTEFGNFLLISEWRFNHRGTIEQDMKKLLRLAHKRNSL